MGTGTNMKADHLFTPNTLSELYTAMDAMGINELVKWKEHVTNHPYSLEGVSIRILEMLDEKLLERKNKLENLT
jgi:hypothetical protein